MTSLLLGVLDSPRIAYYETSEVNTFQWIDQQNKVHLHCSYMYCIIMSQPDKVQVIAITSSISSHAK